MKRRLSILGFSILMSFAHGQNISHLSVDQGLPQSFVSGVVQDDDGFIWISTRNGLARFDGHNFDYLKHRPGDSLSLSSNFVSYIQKGHGQTLWAIYETGEVDAIDYRNLQVRHVLSNAGSGNSIRGWLVAADSLFWNLKISSSTVEATRLNGKETGQTTSYSFESTPQGLIEDSKGRLWVLSSKTISRFDKEQGKFYHIALPYKTDFHYKKGPETLHERNNGELMWMDRGHLYFYDPSQNAFRQTPLPERPLHPSKGFGTCPEGKEFFHIEKSIYSYDDMSGITFKARLENGPPGEAQAFLMDQSGLIWLAPNTDGVYKIDLTTTFDTFRYRIDFAADILEKELGIDLDEYFDMSPFQTLPIAPSYYLRSAENHNKLWIALGRSVCYYDYTNRQAVKTPSLPLVIDSYGSTVPIKGITLTEGDIPLVIDESFNLYLLDKQYNEWKAYPGSHLLKNLPQFKSFPEGIHLENNRIWISTQSAGLIRINTRTHEVLNLRRTDGNLPTDILFGLQSDVLNNNTLWIGSPQGLLRLDTETLEIEVFSVEQGLPDNIIYALLPDKTGQLWLTTNRGLSSFHPITHKVRTFSKLHGLSSDEFNRFHQLPLPEGKMAFGGINNGIVFDPLLVRDDTFQPRTVITNIKLNNTNYDSEAGISYNTVEELNLDYDQNTLSIGFTALQFNQPQDTRYRYRLNGFDKDWVVIGNKREAVYTKIPPGNYEFEVNASNTTGDWSRHVKSLPIRISPPWYGTWWAWTGYLLLLGAAVMLFINYRVDKEKMKGEIALKQWETKRLREVDEMKTRFFSNITHEIRTPLSLITGPAEMLKKNKDEDEQERLISIILKNADSLLNLTNQLLDVAKLEAGMLKPRMVYGDVVLAVAKSLDAFQQEANRRQVQILFEAPQRLDYRFSSNTLERILYNLVSNALKFSYPNGEIIVRLSEAPDGIHLEVCDKGKGIPEEDMPHIFKRFYKGNQKNPVARGTGIGLSLVEELVNLHQGSIDVSSSTLPPAGTTFSIFLPFEKGIPQEANETLENVEETLSDSQDQPLVLVVEDNEELAKFIAYSLRDTYRVLVAENGKEGLEQALKNIPDLILSDVVMEGMDGFELCQSIKSDLTTNHIPIILLTAKYDDESKLKGLELGADNYLAKPFSVSELLMRIGNRMELQKRQRDFLNKEITLLPELETETEQPVQNEFLNEVHQVIDDYLDDESFGVEDLAAELGMSRTSLHRKIKSMANMSAGEIIKMYRLKKAVFFLLQDFNISEVAYKTGFGSPSYFTKCFKDAYQQTPTEYVRKHRLVD